MANRTGGKRKIWSLLKQQRLPAWQPLLSPWRTALCFLIISIICLPLSIILFHANRSAFDHTVYYDQIQHCKSRNSSSGAFRYGEGNDTWQSGCITEVPFQLKKKLHKPVYLYYGLDNFYQNHRRFSRSINAGQLDGQYHSAGEMPDTSPLSYPGELRGNGGRGIIVDGKEHSYRDFVYSPAGLISWAMFNDTFTLMRVEKDEGADRRELICNGTDFSRYTNEPLSNKTKCHKKGIAWSADVKTKYKASHETKRGGRHLVWKAQPQGEENATILGDRKTSPNSNDTFYNNGWYAQEPGHAIPVTTDEDLMVWARIASLPQFRKLYRVITDDLEPGDYVMIVGEHYDVSSFGGRKSFSITTLSWLGGRNSFMAWMYLGLGLFSAFNGVFFLVSQSCFGTRARTAVAELLCN